MVVTLGTDRLAVVATAARSLKCGARRARSGSRTQRETHECCVMAYAGWLAASAHTWLRLEVRRRLKGKTLRGVPLPGWRAVPWGNVGRLGKRQRGEDPGRGPFFLELQIELGAGRTG